MQKWQVWSEGFLVTGMEGIPAPPKLHGEAEAETFAEACDLVLWNEPAAYGGAHYLYDAGRLTYWGCRLFPDFETANHFSMTRDFPPRDPALERKGPPPTRKFVKNS